MSLGAQDEPVSKPFWFHDHLANGTEFLHLTLEEWSLIVSILGGIVIFIGGVIGIIWKLKHWKKRRDTNAELLLQKKSPK